ncbi:hypothetical protein N9Y92_03525 [Chlamydiales bacterium]|nr:hypothetical protein [Chlamydiales bacterium]
MYINQTVIDYFHDGSLFDIQQDDKEIRLYMESCEIIEEGFAEENNITLSKQRGVIGVLHIEKLTDEKYQSLYENIRMDFDEGTILDFEIREKYVELNIDRNYYRKNCQHLEGWFEYKIYYKNVFWENMPELKNPFFDDILYDLSRVEEYDLNGGKLMSCKRQDNDICIRLESKELELKESFFDLTNRNTLLGKIIVQDIKEVSMSPSNFDIKKIHNYIITNFKIKGGLACFGLLDPNGSPMRLEVRGKKSYWENTPDLKIVPTETPS